MIVDLGRVVLEESIDQSSNRSASFWESAIIDRSISSLEVFDKSFGQG